MRRHPNHADEHETDRGEHPVADERLPARRSARLVQEDGPKAPLVVAPGETVDVVAERMALDKVGSAVVVRRGDVVGVFTTIDALEILVGLTNA